MDSVTGRPGDVTSSGSPIGGFQMMCNSSMSVQFANVSIETDLKGGSSLLTKTSYQISDL